MKEIVAIIRSQKVNATKDALANVGFPAFFVSKVLGRGKKHIGELTLESAFNGDDLPRNSVGESFTERTRLIAKRMLTVIVDDADTDSIVEVLIKVNQTGDPGDGKIFIMPIASSYRLRDKALMETAS
ncbi:MAG: P-II family nitrogen regulator [Coriobacteriales bacterium]|jgi:nitrogen regulatory protein PII 2|nr:P-II family nitrogen regulator [Coriobacteriales bacterium]